LWQLVWHFSCILWFVYFEITIRKNDEAEEMAHFTDKQQQRQAAFPSSSEFRHDFPIPQGRSLPHSPIFGTFSSAVIIHQMSQERTFSD
jgi:hypothetical protein